MTRFWIALTALAVAGIGTSSYLTYSHYADRPTECAGIGSCEKVQTSEYSDILGIPVALLGLLFFITFIALCLLQLLSRRRMEWALPVAFSMTLGGVAFVGYLTYVELFVIDAICPWCVATAIITTVCLATTCLAIFTSAREDEFAG